MMIHSHKNNAHRLLAVMLLLGGLVSESGAETIEITAEFRPSLLNKGKDGFQNTTKSTGICTDGKVEARCQNEKVFSIKLAGYAIQTKDIPAMGSERDSVYIKFPASPGKPLKIRLREDSKTMIEAKKPGKFTITKVGASYRERFYGHVPEALERTWVSSWQRTTLASSKSPCPADGSIGIYEQGSYGADHFLWKVKEDGICYKQSEYRRPLNRKNPSSSCWSGGGSRPEATKGSGSGEHCLDDNCSATLQNISFAYELKLPDPLSMASGTYTNVDTDTLTFKIGNSPTDDIDFGDNFKWFGDNKVTLKFNLKVAHDLKVTPEFGAEKVILVPQDGSQRGWDRYLSGGIKPTKLTGRSKFRLSSSGEFTVYLQCGTPFSDTECALTSEDTKRTVPVRAFLTLASNIVVKDDSSQKSVTRQPLRTKKDLPRNIFHTNNPAQNYPGHIDFEVSGEQSIKTLLKKAPDTYKGTVTVIFDANIHA